MRKKVLIVLMPWASIDFPGLGPTLIHSILNAHGHDCQMMYGNLAFCELLENDSFTMNQISKLPISEIAFSPLYFDMDVNVAIDLLETQVESTKIEGVDKEKSRDYYANIVARAEECVDLLFESTPWQEYDVVGFSVMMQQTVASLALAKKIKESFPHINILFGGPSTSSPMGEEMMAAFPEIDYILQGEADSSIVPFIEEIRTNKKDLQKVPGLLYRDHENHIQKTKYNPPFFKLDESPTPDYKPYFEQLRKYNIDNIEPYIQIETSRGCWWGEKHHCTFCGIEDTVLKYRTKSDDKVINEIIELASKHHVLEFFPVDSIISHGAFSSLLPKLGALRKEMSYDFSFFFECKSNLKTESIQKFRDAGVRAVQPGLESFSDHVLKLMDKGTTGARQVQCLKLCAERGVEVDWNLIIENLGEQKEDYHVIIDLIPLISHLPPLHREGVIPVQLNRFAPYHNTPEKFGIKDITPKPYYYDIFPDSSIDHSEMAFYFNFQREDEITTELRALYKKLRKRLEVWYDNYEEGMLIQRSGPGFVEVLDKRKFEHETPTVRRTALRGTEAKLFSACDEVINQESLIHSFKDELSAIEVIKFIDRMVTNRLIYRSESKQLISLPLRSKIPKKKLERNVE